MGAKRATMRDVATASGVSPATVSFVLNGVANQTISPATRERVERAARDLAYVPHGIAKALREGSSRIVLLTLDPAFGGAGSEDYIRGLDAELTRHGHVLLVRHGRTTRGSLAAMVDAVSPRAVIDLAAIYTSGDPTADDGGWVNGLPAHTAVQLRHLVSAGHTRVAMALPDDPALSRLAGVRLVSAREAAPALGLESVGPAAPRRRVLRPGGRPAGARPRPLRRRAGAGACARRPARRGLTRPAAELRQNAPSRAVKG